MQIGGTLWALAAGVASFASPCVLPLIPVYVSIVSGASVEELRSGSTAGLTRRVALGSLAFIVGFTLVFVALGATATALGQVLLRHVPTLTKIGGIVIIILGLHRAFLVGLTFAFGWTPCIGPQLSAILVYAGNQHTVGRGMYLLTVYSL